MDRRWQRFSADDIILGVRLLGKSMFVPDHHRDRMNPVAFYVRLHEINDPKITPHTHGAIDGFLMEQDKYTEISQIVHDLVDADLDVEYSDVGQSTAVLRSMAAKLRSKLKAIDAELERRQ